MKKSIVARKGSETYKYTKAPGECGRCGRVSWEMRGGDWVCLKCGHRVNVVYHIRRLARNKRI